MEYKFRGFDAVGKKGWVYGDLTHNQKVTRTGLVPRTMVAGYEVFPESVGIFTGVHDKKAREIFYGDIVSVYDFSSVYSSPYIGYVAQYRGEWCVCYYDKTFGCEFHIPLCFDDFADRKTEIIGNIFENKELLKKINNGKE